MKCLTCQKEMAIYDAATLLHRLTYDVCESCGALWLDKGELDKMAFQVEGDIEYCSRDIDEDNPVSEHVCPRCPGLKLFRVEFLGTDKIVFDRCENCGGIFLAGGQLGEIDKELARIMPVKGAGFSGFLTGTHLPHFARRTRRAGAARTPKPVLPVAHAKPLGKTDHACPLCGKPLDAYQAYGMKLETCADCHGLWLHKKELKGLRDKIDADGGGTMRWMNDEIAAIGKVSAVKSNRHCPVCREQLLVSARFGASEVTLDWCPQCQGIWLDYDEFEEMQEYQHDEMRALSAAEMEKRAAAVIRRLWTDSSDSKLSEILDAQAVVSTLANAVIFQHPAVTKVVTSVTDATVDVGM